MFVKKGNKVRLLDVSMGLRPSSLRLVAEPSIVEGKAYGRWGKQECQQERAVE